MYLFKGGSWASLDFEKNRVIAAGGDAWRWIAWIGRGPNGERIRYPAEIFGPLPGIE